MQILEMSVEMRVSDFPGLYKAADSLSGDAQSHFFTALILNLLLLVLAAVVSVVNYPHWFRLSFSRRFWLVLWQAPYTLQR